MKTGALLFFPDELLPLLLVFSGIAMIIGARKIAAPARRELRGEIQPGKDCTPGVTRGRPPSQTTAQVQYGLPQPPQVRLTVRLDKGTTVLRNKAQAASLGAGSW